MKILFISHTFPPIVGGVETQNYELSLWLGKITQVTTVANRRGKKWLPFFAVGVLWRIVWSLRKYDVLLLGNGVLSVAGWWAKLFYPSKPVVVVLHGLDLNYNSASIGVWYEKALIAVYQKVWVNIFLKKSDAFIAVGQETKLVAEKKGLPAEKVIFIPNGVDPDKNFMPHVGQAELEAVVGRKLTHEKVLLTSGRLAKRKGVAWFIDKVMPLLPADILYVVAGNGPEKDHICEAIEKHTLGQRVITLGYVDDRTRNILFNASDLFVQPNIKVPGDMEGFGISVIEAGACRLPVVAANIEGLKDAIKDGENGRLVPFGDAAAFVRVIQEMVYNEEERQKFGERARKYIIDNLSWEIIAQKYLEELTKTIQAHA